MNLAQILKNITEYIENMDFLNLSENSDILSMLIAASVISVSILISLAILSQGQKDSVFEEGLILSLETKESLELEEKEKETDLAEEELFKSEEETSSSHQESVAEKGTKLFMETSLPMLTIFMGLIVLIGAYKYATNNH